MTKLARDVTVELKQWDQLAQPPARHARTMQRSWVAFRGAADRGDETVEVFTEEL